jgi:hypothetical protein
MRHCGAYGAAMQTRHLLPLAGLAALALAAPASAPAASSTAAKCSPKGSTAIIADENARVFEKRNAKDKQQFDVFACRYATGKVIKLGVRFRGDPTGVGTFRLAGRYVGYVDNDCDACDPQITVYDLTTGKAKRDVDAAQSDSGEPGVGGFVLAENGAIAWIVVGDETRVFKSDGASPKAATLLDGAKGVDSDSLALAGKRVYWTRAGAPQTATLS